MRAQLVPLDGAEPIEIAKDLMLVGRKEDCDLRLDHKSVSKMHCVIARTGGILVVRDLGSTNGTRVNGGRVRRAILMHNDKLSVAGFEFRVSLGPAEQPVSVHDHTQQLDAKEVAHLLRQLGTRSSKPPDLPPLAVQQNQLPDAYPEDRPKKD